MFSDGSPFFYCTVIVQSSIAHNFIAVELHAIDLLSSVVLIRALGCVMEGFALVFAATLVEQASVDHCSRYIITSCRVSYSYILRDGCFTDSMDLVQ